MIQEKESLPPLLFKDGCRPLFLKEHPTEEFLHAENNPLEFSPFSSPSLAPGAPGTRLFGLRSRRRLSLPVSTTAVRNCAASSPLTLRCLLSCPFPNPPLCRHGSDELVFSPSLTPPTCSVKCVCRCCSLVRFWMSRGPCHHNASIH